MESLVEKLRLGHPDLLFIAGQTCCWSPEKNTIVYTTGSGQEDAWSLLHELGHALLGHKDYKTDLELLQKEMLAWEKARELAPQHNITIEDGYIQNCLDSYRDWLAKRSTCPQCGIKTMASRTKNSYRCFNCHAIWMVSDARHHRPYRLTKNRLGGDQGGFVRSR